MDIEPLLDMDDQQLALALGGINEVVTGDSMALDMDDTPSPEKEAAEAAKAAAMVQVKDLVNTLQPVIHRINLLENNSYHQYAEVDLDGLHINIHVVPGVTEINLKHDRIVELVYAWIHEQQHEDDQPNIFHVEVKDICSVKVNRNRQHTCANFTAGGLRKQVKVSEANVVVGKKYKFDILHPLQTVCQEPKVVQDANENAQIPVPYASCKFVEEQDFAFQTECVKYEPSPIVNKAFAITVLDGEATKELFFSTTRVGMGRQIFIPEQATWDWIGDREAFNELLSLNSGKIIEHMGFEAIIFKGTVLEDQDNLASIMKTHHISLTGNSLESFTQVNLLERGTFIDHVRRNRD
jgi:hypothetical protein